jgi:hypothetical protein
MITRRLMPVTLAAVIILRGAAEYEAALSVAHDSHDLLVRTILAQLETGNHSRVEESERRLAAATPPGWGV